METFISKAKDDQIVSDNFLLAASLAAKFPEKQARFDEYIKMAIQMDTSAKGKVETAKKAIDIFKRIPNQQKVAEWSLALLNMGVLMFSFAVQVFGYMVKPEFFKDKNPEGVN